MSKILRTPKTHPLNTTLRSNDPNLERILTNFLSNTERVESSSFRNPPFVEIPRAFEGRKVWKEFLSSVKDQKTCGGCYAYASTSSLADRFNLRTRGALHLDLSASRIILCDLIGQSVGTESIEQELLGEGVQSIFGCLGNSLFESWRYLYNIGTNTTQCFPEVAAVNKACESVVGNFYDTCIDGAPAVFYRASDVYVVPSSPKDGGSELIMREEIFKSGPVTTAIEVYKNFYTFDPKKEMYKPSGQKMGGHAVVIDGWGIEKGIKFWWVRNSWGADWGLSGYFKLERGVNMCACEENVVAGSPDVGDDEAEGSLFRNVFDVERVGLQFRSSANFFGGIDPDAHISRRQLAYEENAATPPPAWLSQVVPAAAFVAGKVSSFSNRTHFLTILFIVVALILLIAYLNR